MSASKSERRVLEFIRASHGCSTRHIAEGVYPRSHAHRCAWWGLGARRWERRLGEVAMAIDALEAAGLVKRDWFPRDGFSMHVPFITQAGIDALERKGASRG